jgi:hypothetical protein
MKKRPFALLLALLLPALSFAGPAFAPGTKLLVVRTAHFDIIFPEASRPSALYLSEIAEGVHDEVASKLGFGLAGRTPVVVTPDIGTFNGYSALFPYPHIVLFDTSLDIAWTSYEENLRGLFLHELTHTVSLQTRAPWAAFLSGVFGAWLSPAILNAPQFMVEGVTVSFESEGGFQGRANDPLVKERLRQDIVENRFKTPLEASALYDDYPGGSIFYEYGGLFSAWLQESRGDERYAALWQAMGDLHPTLAVEPYRRGFYAIFRKTYGLSFEEAWADFRNSLEVSGIGKVPDPLEADARHRATGLAAGGGLLFWVDSDRRRAFAMDPRTRKTTALFAADSATVICDASADGGRLLVSRSINLPDGRDRVECVVYDRAAGRFLPGSGVAGMRDARFFRDGVVGIVSNLHNTDLVFASKDERRVLLAGSEDLMYSSPAVLGDGRLALIVAIRGRRTIGILDADSGRLELVRPMEAGGGEAATSGSAKAGPLEYVRQLSARDGRILFNWNPGDRFYRLGVLDLGGADGAEGAEGADDHAGVDGAGDAGAMLSLETADFSGGVFWPLSLDGGIYYLGRFSEGTRICRYPDAAAGTGTRRIGFTLEAFDVRAVTAARDEGLAAAAKTAVIEAYRPLDYLRPFATWFPYVDLAAIDRSFRPFGLFLFQDPMDTNAAMLTLGYDSVHPFADLSLSYSTAALPVVLSLGLGDNLVYGGSGDPVRRSALSLQASYKAPFFPAPRALAFGLGGSFLLWAAPGAGEASPYGWPWGGWRATASASLSWTGRGTTRPGDFATGIDVDSYHDFDLASLAYRAEAGITAALASPALRLELWGAWANIAAPGLDSSTGLFASSRLPGYPEFADLLGATTDLLAEGELRLRLANAALHAGLLDLYVNRLLLDAGLRAATAAGSFQASAFARLSLDAGLAEGLLSASSRVFIEGWWRSEEGNPLGSPGFSLGMTTARD